LGARQAVLGDENENAGLHYVTLDARDWPSGVYFCTLQAGDHLDHRKFMILR
jgi:hypothetical protein